MRSKIFERESQSIPLFFPLCTSLLPTFCWIIRRKYDYFPVYKSAQILNESRERSLQRNRYRPTVSLKLVNRINRGELNIFRNFFRFFHHRSTDRSTITLIAVQPSVKQGNSFKRILMEERSLLLAYLRAIRSIYPTRDHRNSEDFDFSSK